MRILLVEDDEMIGRSVADNLASDAYAVDWMRNGQDALEAPFADDFDCCLLDLGLPKVDGIQVLEYWRKNNLKTPVIILTARDDVADRVLGLDKGADDYLVKPFAMSELLARIRAATRRRESASADGSITYGDLTLNPLNYEMRIRNADGTERVEVLTGREFSLRAGLNVSCGYCASLVNMIESRIYGWDEDIDSNALEYIIYTLRRKIGAQYIKNIRGVGWKMNKVESWVDPEKKDAK